jgi:NDP-sugar pyrophosphorylase family protein
MISATEIRQAVLLVGGRGTRMWPLTEDTPKALLPLVGERFIEYQIRLVAAAGVEQVFLAVDREHAASWRSFVDEWDGRPELHLSFEETPLDTAGPVRALLRRLDERFLVLNGDVIFDAPIAEFLGKAPAEAGGVLALVRVEDPSAYGVVVTDDARMVERFVEKPAPGTEPANTVNAGVYVLERDALAAYPAGRLSFERQVFPDLAAAGRLGGVAVEGAWLDIGTPTLYLDTHRAVMKGETGLPHEAGAHVAGEGTTMAGTQAGTWSWIGSGVTIDEGAVVEESVVLDGAVVAEGAVVKRSIIGRSAEIMPGARLGGDVMVGDNAVVGPGCELDCGVRVAPGTKLGPRAVTFRPPK